MKNNLYEDSFNKDKLNNLKPERINMPVEYKYLNFLEKYKTYDVLLLKCKKSFSIEDLYFKKDNYYIVFLSILHNKSEEILFHLFDPYVVATNNAPEISFRMYSISIKISSFFDLFEVEEILTNIYEELNKRQIDFNNDKFSKFIKVLNLVAQQGSCSHNTVVAAHKQNRQSNSDTYNDKKIGYKCHFVKPISIINILPKSFPIKKQGKENLMKNKNNIKIIQSNKFKTHMEVHKNQFIISYEILIKYMELNNKFQNIGNGLVEMVAEFPFYIGYTNICKISDKHEIVYAKRKNRDIYSKFTLDGEPKLTNKCVVILNQSYTNPNEYYLITMFPGEYVVKEPQDRNIKTEEERKKVLKFWENHALIFNPKEIDLETITYDCPYKHNT